MSGSAPLLGVYRPFERALVRGEGSYVVDETGREYLDFTSGIGVTALGHGSPVVRAAIERALQDGLVHTSNLFRTRPGEELAALLVERSFPAQVFFCNSGAEAGEAAIKFARRWARSLTSEGSGASTKVGIAALEGSFHGRLAGTLALTDRPAYRAPFEPLMPGVEFLPVGDLEAASELLSAQRTAALFVEPVQGEGGVRPLDPEYLRGLRRLCDEREIALVFDEVQCGLGRTGHLFAHQSAGVQPDIFTLAKPLAGGLPMGAVIVADRIAATIRPGDHATTFGGGPLVATVALAVVREIARPAFLASVRARSERLSAELRRLAASSKMIREVRGVGLMQGIETTGPALPHLEALREAGLLVTLAGAQVLRLLPPLTVTEAEIDEAVQSLSGVLDRDRSEEAVA